MSRETEKKNSPSKIRRADPFFERESTRYDNPLPSREYIVQTLEETGMPMSADELVQALDIQPEEREHFVRRLSAMEREAQLMRNRRDAYIIPDKADLVAGRVEGHPDGFGFVITGDGKDKKGEKGDKGDIFLSAQEMRSVLHGDRVLVRVTGLDRRGRREGRVVEVTERGNTRLVARVVEEHGVQFCIAENRRIRQQIVLAAPEKGKRALKAAAGSVVEVELIEQPTRYTPPIGRVVEVLGNFGDSGMEIEIALRKHDMPHEFSAKALAAAKRLPDEVRPEDIGKREDLRALPLVTIDGETARDFDDAVYAERQGKGFRLIVAIADVSHYVKPDAPLDIDAFERGNSVYFPRRVIPMLPEKLSNGLCSLNPEVDRLCMVCDMDVSATGAIQHYSFYAAVMNSKARLTYTEVAAAIYDKDPATRERLQPLLPRLEALDAVFRVFEKARAKRGAIDFETVETLMLFNDEGKIDRIVPYARNDAHRLIEECMLAANVCASRFLEDSKQPTLYRVHEGPSEDRLQKLRAFLGEFGFQLGGGDKPHAKDYAALLTQIGDRPDRQLLQTVMLRSLRQAVYSPDNVGHFGLAYEAYTHFTSPIRRYPDLLVHRAIKAALAKKRYEPGDWSDIGLHCSTTERRADEASRDVQNWLKCYFMQDRVGEEFEGSVSAVVPFGLFVALDNVFIEGLVHISELGADYFHYEEGKHRLVGERSGRMYRLADRVRIQVVRVDLDNTRIEFRLAGGGDDFGRVPRASLTPKAGPTGPSSRKRVAVEPVEPTPPPKAVKAGRGRAARKAAQASAAASSPYAVPDKPSVGKKPKAASKAAPDAPAKPAKQTKSGAKKAAKPKAAKPEPAKREAAKSKATKPAAKAAGKPAALLLSKSPARSSKTAAANGGGTNETPPEPAAPKRGGRK
ncbi:ribonuclease R [Methyloversatilis sp. XJ19-13]|uniref:ribonuclease R n=1 Tax=Methyloversatilis sp. XJ19-13 TaxID=2963430 RepID=UPI00211B8C84|nr:ribonuclease R [Methyloversatilis sp. XJ19-13]MCQ9373347.1 ribonuclease R [Methyloversatilis sp. XJ19-13]